MSDYLDRVYKEMLGRAPDPTGRAAYAGWPEAMVRQSIANSSEYARRTAAPASSGSSGLSMSGFLGGFSPSSSSALDGILKKMYEWQLEEAKFMSGVYREHQLPYERDYWGLARQYLPTFMDHSLRSGENVTRQHELLTGLGEYDLAERAHLYGPQMDLALGAISTQARLLPYDETAQRTGFVLQQAMNQAGERLVPYQEGADRTGLQLEQGMNKAQMRMLPYQEAADRTGLQYQQFANQSGMRLLPHQEAAAAAGLRLDTGRADMGLRLLPYQEGADRTGLQLAADQNVASRWLLPQQVGLESADIARQQSLMPHRQYAAEQFFREADQGVNPEQWAARAGIDVGAAYAGADAALRRDAARMGVDPSSGRFAAAQGGYGLNMARDLAQARTLGRRAGEDENWQRRMAAAMYAR